MADSPALSEQAVAAHALRHHFADLEQQRESSTLGMWVFLVTEIMFFGGLFAAYLVYRTAHFSAWVEGSQAYQLVPHPVGDDPAVAFNHLIGDHHPIHLRQQFAQAADDGLFQRGRQHSTVFDILAFELMLAPIAFYSQRLGIRGCDHRV